ncbi:MAG: hypothetical protein M3Z01_04560 [Thermoproteota archaeon]|nr:hypothetical protein [Thermoproteota archaeon]
MFDLDQSNIRGDIQKIEPLIRTCVSILQKIYNVTKRLMTFGDVELYFLGFLYFVNSPEQQIPRPPAFDKDKKNILFRQEEKTRYKESTNED